MVMCFGGTPSMKILIADPLSLANTAMEYQPGTELPPRCSPLPPRIRSFDYFGMLLNKKTSLNCSNYYHILMNQVQ